MLRDFRRRFWVSLAVTVPVLGLSPVVRRWLGWTEVAFPGQGLVLWVLSTFVYAYGGWPFLEGLVREARRRRPGMMTLVGLAITVAFGYSTAVVFGVPGEVFFWELTTLIDIMLLGHWVEMRSVLGASRALEALVRWMPHEAHRVRPDGSVEDVPVTDLRPGDRVWVRPGEKVPADGRILEGRTTMNEALLTGESRPVEKGPGDPVIGGAINGEAAVTVEVTRTGEDTYLAQVVRLVRQAQAARSRTQDLADRAAFGLTVVAIAAGTVTLVVWLALRGDWAFALERMVTVMVITCPHALGLAVPLVVAVSTALAAAGGFLVRDRSAFERARGLQAVVFDKTGTLTLGVFGVTDVVPLTSGGPDADGDERTVLQLAASVEQPSEHPLATGIRKAAEDRGIPLLPVTDFRALPGRGAEGTVGGRVVRVVSPGYLREQGISVDDPRVRAVQDAGKTVVYVLADGRPVGAIALADRVRPESREAVQNLHRMGIRVMMLTGDNRKVAAGVARELGLDEFFAEVLPHEKVDTIRRLQARGLTVAMVGDGINDAPALVQADVGIAIGAGTDVAVESADIVLVRNDPRDVANVVRLSRKTYAKMVQNLLWATGYNIVAVPLAAGVLAGRGILLSPAVGAVLMSLSTVLVALNARSLRR